MYAIDPRTRHRAYICLPDRYDHNIKASQLFRHFVNWRQSNVIRRVPKTAHGQLRLLSRAVRRPFANAFHSNRYTGEIKMKNTTVDESKAGLGALLTPSNCAL